MRTDKNTKKLPICRPTFAQSYDEALRPSSIHCRKKVKGESKVSPPFMEKYLKDYQEPAKMDKMGQVLKEVGELKLQLKDNLVLLLDRGEKLDDIVEKAEDLSDLSKEFYIQSKKHNQCCKSW
uniref:V-SNARE coiled-coil homology domain-containing protein n=1 Tax=Lotharella globosa TaxID=91324 RepID=A0A7S3ZIG5_9EUKA